MNEFNRLLNIMEELREKCPWDKKQTFESLSHLTIEETYELCDAIIKNDTKGIKEEVGDLFLHLVFYAKILKENEGIEIDDILKAINDKLIHRHPHVFESQKELTEDEVKQNWEQLKLKEGRKSIYSGVPLSLPSVVKAFRIQDKAAQVGFDWDAYQKVREKLSEEILEFDEAVQSKNIEHIEEELGDLMFTMVNLSRFLKIDPERALQNTNAKFIQRFQYIEDNALKPIHELSLDEMEALWIEAKSSNKG